VDLVEFYWICKACDGDPEAVAGELIREFKKIERREKRRR
jgi:hypothetical protein